MQKWHVALNSHAQGSWAIYIHAGHFPSFSAFSTFHIFFFVFFFFFLSYVFLYYHVWHSYHRLMLWKKWAFKKSIEKLTFFFFFKKKDVYMFHAWLQSQKVLETALCSSSSLLFSQCSKWNVKCQFLTVVLYCTALNRVVWKSPWRVLCFHLYNIDEYVTAHIFMWTHTHTNVVMCVFIFLVPYFF